MSRHTLKTAKWYSGIQWCLLNAKGSAWKKTSLKSLMRMREFSGYSAAHNSKK